MKKGAAILVQNEHNSFTINRISQKSNRKSEQFRGKITLFQPFFGQIGEVFHTLAHGFSLPRTCSAGVSLAVVRASRWPSCGRLAGRRAGVPARTPLFARSLSFRYARYGRGTYTVCARYKASA